MTPERWQLIKSSLHEAMSLDGTDRRAFIARLEASDADLCSEVQSLLLADESAGDGFLSTPPLAGLGLATEQTSFVGRRLGPYRLTEEIGAGGMGEVYKAVRADKEYEHEVAIKLVHAGHGPSFVATRLRAERQILASLQHPHIARLLDGGTTDEGIPYLVMELIDGQPITDYCDGQKLDTAARLRLFIQVCSAVQYAHQRMVIHRDLKPSNILVTREGVPKLLDFGIAKILEPGTNTDSARADLTIAALGILTPQYASPEQLQGESVTAASDVYSLGVLLYELLAGVRPYALPDKTPHQQRLAALDAEPKRPSAVARYEGGQRRLRGDLDRIVLMALRKEPERRYGTVDQFAEDVRRHLQHRPVVARAPTLAYVTASFFARHTAGVVAAGLIVLALTGGIFATLREARIAERHRAHAEQRFNDVRKLANSLIFDIDDSIRDLPGASSSRKLLIGTALRYLGGLASEAVNDPAFQLEMAAAYIRLGDIQGGFQQSQDDYAGATKSFQSALALIQSALAAEPDNIRARRDMSRLYLSLSDLAWTTGDGPGALAYDKHALDDSGAIAASQAADPENAFWLALYTIDYGYKVFRTGGDIHAAIGYMRSAIATLEPRLRATPKDARVRRLVAVSYYKTSEALIVAGEFAEALSMNENAARVLEPGIAAAPADPDLRVVLAATSHYSAAALMNLGRLEEATRYEKSALGTVRALRDADPKVAEFQGFVGIAQLGLADIAVRQGQAAQAIELLKDALTASEAALSAGTMHPYIRHAKGKSESLMGTAYAMLATDASRSAKQRLQDWQDARTWYQRAYVSLAEIRVIWDEAARDATHVSAEIARCNSMLAGA